MPSCTRPEGIPSTCRNKIINPVSNRLIQCQACKDHSRAIQVLQKRAATKRARHCRQAAFNLNRVINLDLRTEDSDLRQALDDLEAEKAAMQAMIDNKLREYATLARTSQNLLQLLPETTILSPDAPEDTPRSPPAKNRKPASQEWKTENRKHLND